MKVLKKGRPQKKWAIECECTGIGNGNGGCGAKLLVEQDDIFKTESYHYDGSHNDYNTFECPECGVLTDVGNVPFSVPKLSAWKKAQR